VEVECDDFIPPSFKCYEMTATFNDVFDSVGDASITFIYQNDNNAIYDLKAGESIQDWGVKNATGGREFTPIFGYAKDENSDATYPGPTILVTKNCPVNITFHNKLGTDPHIFGIDRSLICEAELLKEICANKTFLDGRNFSVAPEGTEDDFYCLCVSPHGSERRATVHLHGAHVEAQYDGHPESWYTDCILYEGKCIIDGGSRFNETGVNEFNETVFQGYNRYPNNQSAATLFFHDHAKGITRLNVYAGLAALYIIVDPFDEERNGKLPPVGGDHDFGMAFNDKEFLYDESLPEDRRAPLHFPTGIIDGDGGFLPPFSVLPEMFGYTMTANGMIYPYLEVNATELYRFRLLNACDSRYLRLFIAQEYDADRLDFTVIGSDQGLLPETVVVDEIMIAPGERYELAVIFPNTSQPYYLFNSEITLLGPVVPGLDDQFMKFCVNNHTVDPAGTSLPEWNQKDDLLHTRLKEASTPDVVGENILETRISRRQLWITERTQQLSDALTFSAGRPLPLLGPREKIFGTMFDDPITENPIQNQPTIWELLNLSNDAHAIHLHQLEFRILYREDVGLSYTTFQTPTGTFRQFPKNFGAPEPYEAGPKDIVISYPGTRTSIVMIFKFPGRYVWHCHMLSHEDHMMMHEFVVASNRSATEILLGAKGVSGNCGQGIGKGGSSICTDDGPIIVD
jgi:spore coat protein A